MIGSWRPAGKLARRNRTCLILTGVAIAVMVTRIVLTYRVFNDTADEPYHIGSAVAMIESGRHIRGTQHPPLTRLITGAALKLAGVEHPSDRNVREIQLDLTAFEVGHEVLLRSTPGYWKVLTVARISTLIFPIAAVFYVYLIGRYVAGALPGCLAAICFSTDPTLLAHGGLVTTDVAAAAGFLAATYHGVKFIARPDWKRSLIAGIALGLALSCKFSCIAVIPGLVLIALLRRRRALFEGPVHRYFKSWPRISRVATVLLTAFVTLWATFLFDFGRIQASPALQKGAEWYSIPNWLKSTPIPMPAIVPGFMMVVQHNRAGHSTYINGSLEAFGTVSYFPEAIILKTPAAVLVGLVLAIGSAILARRLPPMLGITLFPFAVYMLISMNAKLNLGIRHVLPAIPFLYLLLMQQLALVRMNLFAMIVTALAFIETLCLHPDYLAFFNVFAGGPRSGEKYLLDSNLDWGQDQFRLAKWLEQNAKGRIVTDRVFGNPRLREWQHEGYTILPPGSVPRGLLAVSKNEAYGLYLGVWDDADGKRHVEAPLFGLERYKRVARIGYTIDVYDLDASVGAPSR